MTSPEAWEHELANAFEALLGSPLSTFPTTSNYVVYSWADEMSADALDDFLNGDLDLDAIARNELIGEGWEPDEPEFAWDRFPIDHGRSIWRIEDYAVEALGEPVAAAVREVAAFDISERVLSGADLARVLLAHRDQLEEVDVEDLAGNVQLLQRIHTNGTLFDAMRSATWTLGGPGELVPFEGGAEVEPAWEEALGRVGDPRLRDHLRMLCLDAHWARSDGAYYLGADCSIDLRWIAEQPGHEAVAGWEFGEGQAAIAVFGVK